MNNYLIKPSISKKVFHEFPESIRDSYRNSVKQTEDNARHKALMALLDESIKYIASVALSDYRSKNFMSPWPEVEEAISQIPERMSLGHYVSIFKICVKAPSVSIFDEKLLSQSEELHATNMFFKAVGGIREAIDLRAKNLERMVDIALKSDGKAKKWAEYWDLFVNYRNCADGHPKEHKWPIENPQYYTLMTQLFENALVEMLTSKHFMKVIFGYPIAALDNIEHRESRYLHRLRSEHEGIPIDIVIETDKAITKFWDAAGWSCSTGDEFMLRVTGDGAYEIYGLFHDLGTKGRPKPMSIQSTKNNVRTVAPKKSAGHVPWSQGIGRAYGTCGELVQGFFSDGTPFHLTLPISKTSSTSIRMRPNSENSVVGIAENHRKKAIACRAALEHFGRGPSEVIVDHWSDLHIGKGMGSSTADILSIIYAVSDALGEDISEEEVAHIATGIESSDGTMYEGINFVNHKNGKLIKRLTWWPDYTILMCVPPNIFNTESANFDGKQALGKEFDEIYAQVVAASKDRDAYAFSEACHRSSEINQRYLPNPLFSKLRKVFMSLGALGVCVGHTGTVAGLLFAGDDGGEIAGDALFEIQKTLPSNIEVEIVRLREYVRS